MPASSNVPCCTRKRPLLVLAPASVKLVVAPSLVSVARLLPVMMPEKTVDRVEPVCKAWPPMASVPAPASEPNRSWPPSARLAPLLMTTLGRPVRRSADPSVSEPVSTRRVVAAESPFKMLLLRLISVPPPRSLS